jgi:Ca2+-binding RTX toxin-like protein
MPIVGGPTTGTGLLVGLADDQRGAANAFLDNLNDSLMVTNGSTVASVLIGDLWWNGAVDAGNDFLRGGAASDKIWGDFGTGGDFGVPEGTARPAGVGGDDQLYGADGDDSMYGGAGADFIYGEAGTDLIYGGDGTDYLYGDQTNTLDDLPRGGAERLYGGNGNDYMYGGWLGDTLYGGSDNDYLFGGGSGIEFGLAEADDLYGGAGQDFLYGYDGADTLRGEAGADQIIAGAGNDKAYGGADVDNVAGGAGNDTAYGGDANDRVDGNDGRDSLAGGAGNDVVFGEGQNDKVSGGSGNDTVYGGSDNDTVMGSTGIDVLLGDGGADRFVFADGGASNRDTITDFVRGTDRIALDNDTFRVGSALTASEFRVVATVAELSGIDASDRIVFVRADATLYYDRDGRGGAAASAFATVTGATTLSLSDLTVVD